MGIMGCAAEKKPVSVIPKPLTMNITSGTFTINQETTLQTDLENGELKQIAAHFRDLVKTGTGIELSLSSMADKPKENLIRFELVSVPDTLEREGYLLNITKNRILLQANQPAGLFRGVQTVRQLLPPFIENKNAPAQTDVVVPTLTIVDKPRFPWRGMLLDCGRHFMTKDFVKRYIDLLAYHKMNTLHWHLTEDQGWRIEIKKYPKLTTVGAWRIYEDGEKYGGYYTQEDIKEVVAYAESRYINVVPEIEMPGHSVAALAAYPQFSCTGGPFEVQTQWGVHKDVYCAGNEKTFAFLEDVLTEVMELFPSTYIHIGGDECPKDRWKECRKCQKRIRREKLADEHELQSYFITRMERFLNKHGRQIIGWDEILEGGLAPGATVQSWRGVEGGIAAAQSGHDAIMSPTSHAYFDYDIGTTDLRQVYSFEPIPPTLDREQEKHILGGECNMWTERAPQERVDYMMFPRMLAMSEVLWSQPVNRDYDDFYLRVQEHYPRLEYVGVKYGPESKPLSVYARFDSVSNNCLVTMETGEKNLEMRYTLDNSEPDYQSRKYNKEIVLDRTMVLKGKAFKNGKPYGLTDSLTFYRHKGVGHAPRLVYPYSYKYKASGKYALVDGLIGSGMFNDGQWQGFEGTDVDLYFDLGAEKDLSEIRMRFIKNTGSWIFLPTMVTIYTSEDGADYTKAEALSHSVPENNPDVVIQDFNADMNNISTRYLRIHAESIKTCPDWHPGAGGPSWLFLDEVIIELGQ
jgi:hexosaminidase